MTSSDSTAPPTAEHHAVIVALGACDPREDHPGEPHFDDCYERSVECPELTPTCESWEMCQDPECKTRDTEEPPDDVEGTFHGVDHKHMSFDGSGWAIATGHCFYQTSDSICDAISELELKEPGRYPVEVEVDDVYPVLRLAPLPKVYLFANGKWPHGDLAGMALAEDGNCLAQHISSHEGFLREDLHDREFRHEPYREHFGGWGDGQFYELVMAVPPQDVLDRARALALAAEPAEEGAR